MNIFVRMLRDVYGIEGSITEAPPRLSLKMFGGPFDIEPFRRQTMTCSIVTPPFISYCMLLEERNPYTIVGDGESHETRQRGTVRGLRRPTTNVMEGVRDTDELCAPENDGLYNSFLKERMPEVAEDTTAAPPAAKKQKVARATRANTTSASSSSSGLAKFACSATKDDKKK
tara:strand:+ start:200 stop:715 length:516 start_codon:yes stop_codon:yes gene_type:complete